MAYEDEKVNTLLNMHVAIGRTIYKVTYTDTFSFQEMPFIKKLPYKCEYCAACFEGIECMSEDRKDKRNVMLIRIRTYPDRR